MSEIISKSPTIIEKVGTGYVLFYNTNSKLDFSTKDVANLSLTPDLQYILIDDGGGTIYKIDVVNLTSVVDRSIAAPFTPLDPMANPIATGDYSDQIRAVYDYLLKNIYKACCVSSAPTYVGSLISAYPDLGTLQASAPGTTGILYTTTDTNLLYWWDSVASDFKLVSGVQYFANFASFPVTGEERVLYYDIAEGEMYVWESGAYKSLCCEASHLQQKYSQTGHGFSVGEWVYADGDGTFALTLADDISTSYAVGVVQQVIDANTFVLNHGGFLSVGVPAEPGGTVMYLDETTPGTLRNTAPAAPNIVRPVMVVLDNATTGLVLLSLQNEGAGGGGGVASVSGESVDNTDPINPVVNAWPLAGTGTDLANGTIEVDPAFSGKIIELDDTVNGTNSSLFMASLASSIAHSGTIGFSEVRCDGSMSEMLYSDIASTLSGRFSIESNLIGTDYGTYPIKYLIDGRRIQPNGVAAPTSSDDANRGYGLNSSWIYDGRLWICEDATIGAAVWNEVGAGGGGLSLETDGTPNGDQTLLNLIGGTGITLTDDGVGGVTIDAAPGQSITPITRAALQTLLGSASADPNTIYRITDALGATAELDVFVASSSALTGFAIDQTNLDIVAYNIGSDTAISLTAGLVSDTAYGVSWNGVTGVAPSKNAVYDIINTLPTTNCETWVNAQGSNAVPAGTTTFAYLNGGTFTLNTTEHNRQFPAARGGTLSRLYIRTANSQPASGSLVATVRVNGVDTSIVITIAAGSAAGIFSNTVDTAAFSAGDLLSLKLVNNASSNSAQVLVNSILVTY